MPKPRVSKNYECDENRKENSSTRKRKATSPAGPRPQKAKTTCWALDSENTDSIYRELGVGPLSENSVEGSETKEYTPDTHQADRNKASLAPRILLPSQRSNFPHSPSSSSNNSSLCAAQDDFLEKKSLVSCGPDYFSQLSDELVLNIFILLPKIILAKCARVCRRWTRLTQDDTLWKRLDLGSRSLKAGVVGLILKRGVVILRLAKAEIESPIFTGPTRVFSSTRLSRLKYLDLSMAAVSTGSLEEVLAICHDLRKLSLENCEVNDTICSYIGENKELEVLNMCLCRGITDTGLMPITSNCRKLESLNLAWTGLQQHSIMYLALCLPENLSKLNISGFRENITDDEVKQLVKTCPSLIELDLSDSTMISCQSIHHIVDNLSCLEYLSLSRCYRVLAPTLLLLNNMSSLTTVDIFGMLQEGVLQQLKENMVKIDVNKFLFSTIARPTTGIHRTSIWGLRVRDNIL